MVIYVFAEINHFIKITRFIGKGWHTVIFLSFILLWINAYILSSCPPGGIARSVLFLGPTGHSPTLPLLPQSEEVSFRFAEQKPHTTFQSCQDICFFTTKFYLTLGLGLLEIKARKTCGPFMLSCHISILRQWAQSWLPIWMGQVKVKSKETEPSKNNFNTIVLKYSQAERAEELFPTSWTGWFVPSVTWFPTFLCMPTKGRPFACPPAIVSDQGEAVFMDSLTLTLAICPYYQMCE